MSLRRSFVLVAASVAALTMGGEAMAAPAAPTGPEQGDRRVTDLELPARATARAVESGSLFTARRPVRVLDTRSSGGAVPARGVVTVDLSDQVPEGTWAVVLNLTGVSPTSASYVTVWPAEEDRPGVSNLNLAAGEIRSNAVTVALGPSRQLNMYNNSGSINLVADLAGHYAPDGEGYYKSRSPQRLLDTRNGRGPIPGGGTITVDTSSVLGTSGATAVTINLTVVSPTTATYLTAYPTGTTRPTASSINVARGTTTANQVTVAVGPDKDVRLYNNAGSAHVIIDVVGHYDIAGGDVFYPVLPVRVADTRSDGGGPLEGGYYYGWAWTRDAGSPDANISSLVLNVTGIGGASPTYLTLFPSGASTVPNASTLNLAARQTAANMANVSLGWDADSIGSYYGFNVYNNAGYTHVAMDLAGIFEPPTA